MEIAIQVAQTILINNAMEIICTGMTHAETGKKQLSIANTDAQITLATIIIQA